MTHANTIRRWTPTWPSRKVPYLDLTPWDGGYLCTTTAPGAVRWTDGQGRTWQVNLQTHEVTQK